MSPSMDKRSRLTEAADRLFHRQGYERSTIADVAHEAGVPPGNVYYYFKTKEDLVDAVTRRRNELTYAWLGRLDALGPPVRRLTGFVEEFERTREERAQRGCPVGSLCQEVNKIGGPIAEQAAVAFQIILDWLEHRFAELGESPKRRRASAVHLLASLQGATLLAHSFRDPELVHLETRRLRDWLGGLAQPTVRAK